MGKLGPRRLEDEAAWLERYRQLWDARFDELDKVVEGLKWKEHRRQAPRDRRLHHRPTLAPRVTRGSSSCSNCSGIPPSPPGAPSRASFVVVLHELYPSQRQSDD
jgi:hypothetical protein